MFENKIFELKDLVLTLEDFKQYALKQRNITWLIMLGWKIFGLGYILVILLIFILGGRNGEFSPTWDIVLIMTIFKNLVVVFILVIVPWVVHPLIVRRLLKANYQKNKLYATSNNYEFFEDGLRITSKNGESRYLWNELYGVVKTPELLKIHISKQTAFIIPKRYLEGKDELVKFIEQSFS